MPEYKMDEKKVRLAGLIDSHPIFKLPANERISSPQLMSVFTDLVMEYEGLYEKLDFDQERYNEKILTGEGNPFGKKYDGLFDGVTWYKALLSSVSAYDPETGISFMPFFRSNVNRSMSEATHLDSDIGAGNPHLLKEQDLMVRRVKRILKSRCLEPNMLTDEDKVSLAKQLNITPRRLDETLGYMGLGTMKSLDERIGGDDSEDTYLDIYSPESEDAYAYVDMKETLVDCIIEIINAVTAEEIKESVRLFLTNDILSRIKGVEKKDVGKVNYPGALKESLCRREETLYERVFIMAYLSFVYETPPDPATIELLYSMQLEYPIEDKTIRIYKNLSKARISQIRRDDYRDLSSAWKEMAYGIIAQSFC